MCKHSWEVNVSVPERMSCIACRQISANKLLSSLLPQILQEVLCELLWSDKHQISIAGFLWLYLHHQNHSKHRSYPAQQWHWLKQSSDEKAEDCRLHFGREHHPGAHEEQLLLLTWWGSSSAYTRAAL